MFQDGYPRDPVDEGQFGSSTMSATNSVLSARRSVGTRSEKHEEKQNWEEALECAVCLNKVGKRYLKPRHHCRVCKRCVCGTCSPNQVTLGYDSVWGDQPQRVCIECCKSAFTDEEGMEETAALLKEGRVAEETVLRLRSRIEALAERLSRLAGDVIQPEGEEPELTLCEEALDELERRSMDPGSQVNNTQVDGRLSAAKADAERLLRRLREQSGLPAGQGAASLEEALRQCDTAASQISQTRGERGPDSSMDQSIGDTMGSQDTLHDASIAHGDGATCEICSKKFMKVVRPRHHCRVCDHYVCNSCSGSRVVFEGRDNNRPQRVCNECIQGWEYLQGLQPSITDWQNRLNYLNEQLEGIVIVLDEPPSSPQVEPGQSCEDALANCEDTVEVVRRGAEHRKAQAEAGFFSKGKTALGTNSKANPGIVPGGSPRGGSPEDAAPPPSMFGCIFGCSKKSAKAGR